MNRSEMTALILNFIDATDPSPFNPKMDNMEYVDVVEWNDKRRENWVAEAPPEWLDIALDIAVNPPDLHDYNLRDADDWRHGIDELLGEWGRHDPIIWGQKVRPLLQDEKSRSVALSAMASVGRGSEVFLTWLRPFIENPVQLSKDELLDLITTIGQADNHEATQLLDELRELIQPEQIEALQEIDMFQQERRGKLKTI
jgi:hypothetical protein